MKTVPFGSNDSVLAESDEPTARFAATSFLGFRASVVEATAKTGNIHEKRILADVRLQRGEGYRSEIRERWAAWRSAVSFVLEYGGSAHG